MKLFDRDIPTRIDPDEIQNFSELKKKTMKLNVRGRSWESAIFEILPDPIKFRPHPIIIKLRRVIRVDKNAVGNSKIN